MCSVSHLRCPVTQATVTQPEAAGESFRWNCNVCTVSLEARSRSQVKRKALEHLRQAHAELPHIT